MSSAVNCQLSTVNCQLNEAFPPAGLAKNEFMRYTYGNPKINFKTNGRKLVSADKYQL
ncbi:hypothetical protein [Microcoleus sp. CAWBG58]|uniref:hypothetical protein n=1 Tax=Microcoleus sp. CAWBG58 TaxID=2841651 RepID=UPI0025F1A4AA|nr:hypothetical protein [Microcoleus sp. CAWBG58]